MEAVSNQLPTQEFKIPVEPKPRFLLLTKIVQKVAFAIILTALSAALFVSFGGLELVALDTLIFGGTIGFLAALWVPFPTGIEGYRAEVLDKLQRHTANPRAGIALSNLLNFLHYPLTQFSHLNQQHHFYHELASVTNRLDPERKDVCTTWEGFLNHLNGKKVKLSQGKEIELDMRHCLSKMKGKQIQSSHSWLGTFFGVDQDALTQIVHIQDESIDPKRRLSRFDIETMIRSNGYCIVSRDPERKIQGYGLYFEQDGVVEIASLACKPEFAGFGIGSSLLLEILKVHKKKQKVVRLRIEPSNPFISSFTRWGFEKAQGSTRKELVLELNWTEFEKAVNQQ